MNPAIHSFAELGGHDRRGIRYIWDDTRASNDFSWPLAEVELLADRMAAASLRARLGLCIALFEVITARLSERQDDVYPLQVIESAWVSLADRRYLVFDERARSEWLGPIRGPLWCAFTWLTPALHEPEEDPAEWKFAFVYLARLARHLLSPEAQAALDRWLDACIERIVQFHPKSASRPTEDLFGRRAEWRRGPYVTADCFDLATPYDAAAEHGRLQRLLHEVDVDANPLLKPVADLRDEGLADPYGVLPPRMPPPCNA